MTGGASDGLELIYLQTHMPPDTPEPVLEQVASTVAADLAMRADQYGLALVGEVQQHVLRNHIDPDEDVVIRATATVDVPPGASLEDFGRALRGEPGQ